MIINCEYCGAETKAKRVTKRFCSNICSQRRAQGYPKIRACRNCGKEFQVLKQADANRQHCSRQCAKNYNTRAIKTWAYENPAAIKKYRANRKLKNPTIWKEKHDKERLEIIKLLGGACVICGVTKHVWLHVDYIPTQKEEQYRHPRHLAFVRRNPNLFRLLCANHHYELTLTGYIEGSDITQ